MIKIWGHFAPETCFVAILVPQPRYKRTRFLGRSLLSDRQTDCRPFVPTKYAAAMDGWFGHIVVMRTLSLKRGAVVTQS